jgi:hypothetical protein
VTLHARSDVTSVSSLAGHNHVREDGAERLVLDCAPCEREVQANALWQALWSDDPTVLPLTPKERQDAERRERQGTRAMADLADALARQAAASVAAEGTAKSMGEVDLAAAVAAATPEQLDQLLALAAERKAEAERAAAQPAPEPPAKPTRTRARQTSRGNG